MNIKKIITESLAAVLLASVGASATNTNIHAESNSSADNTLDRVLYKWPHKTVFNKRYSPNPIDLSRVKGHKFLFSYINTHMYVDGRRVSYRRGLALYRKYAHKHYRRHAIKHHRKRIKKVRRHYAKKHYRHSHRR